MNTQKGLSLSYAAVDSAFSQAMLLLGLALPVALGLVQRTLWLLSS